MALIPTSLQALIVKRNEHTVDRDTFKKSIILLHATKNMSMKELSKETLNLWYKEMVRRGWSKEFFAERCRAVLDTKIFGQSLTFDNFLDAKAMYSKEEMLNGAMEILENRKRQMREAKISQEEIEAEGLEEIQHVYQRERALYKEAIIEKQKARVKEIENFLRTCGQHAAQEIHKVIMQKGLIDEKEIYWREMLHLFAPEVIEEASALMNNPTI